MEREAIGIATRQGGDPSWAPGAKRGEPINRPKGTCMSLHDQEFPGFRVGDLVTGTVQHFDGATAEVRLGTIKALLPRAEQIPAETFRDSQQIRAVILNMPKLGQRSRIILSRTHPDLLRRLFETEVPEIADQTVTIQVLAREAGYRSKVAVSSSDINVDAVIACVGVQGTRIKSIVDELRGERIDIVRWSESPQDLIPDALQPAEIDKVTLHPLLGRALVLVREDQLSLAIGRRGQNVRLASQLVGWDLEIMTSGELAELTEKAAASFTRLDGVDRKLAQELVEQGILSFRDLSTVPPPDLIGRIEGLNEELAARIVAQAGVLAEES
jgi:N utilization substance protein A